jgi:hypothetical protein
MPPVLSKVKTEFYIAKRGKLLGMCLIIWNKKQDRALSPYQFQKFRKGQKQ